jgi:pyruvate ferredoxin oxidoreductase alpha subunit
LYKVITGDASAAYGARLSDVDVVAAYPITPQTFIVEHISEWISNGELTSKYIKAESEHSAISAVIGASAVGARTFTATASQGLALMHEILFFASGAHLPIVMPVVNRTVAAPLAIWCEYNDSMPQRDTGWIQLYVEDNQEILDTVIQAYKIAEHDEVLLPVMICMDAFVLSHTVEPVNIPDLEAVRAFLPPYSPKIKLDPDNPMAIGPFVFPEYIMEMRYQQEMSMKKAIDVIKQVDAEFCARFGRGYGGLLEPYRLDGAKYVLLTLGTITGSVRIVVDELRSKGYPVGLIKIRSFRPFPLEELRSLCKDVEVLGVIDRSISFGSGGPTYIETRSALYNSGVKIINFLVGIGGRDVGISDIHKIYKLLMDKQNKQEIFWFGARI